MITKEAIEAAARAMCEAWHYSKIGTPDGDAEWRRKQDQYRMQARAALTAAFAAMPGPAVRVKPLEWVDAPKFMGDDEVTYAEAVGAGYTYIAEAVDCTLEDAKAEREAEYEANIMAAIYPAPALAAMPGPAVKDGVFEFDRYINGRLMAEGVTIERETTFEAAAASAARIASRGPNGEAPVLVMRPPAPDLASENERLRAALEWYGEQAAATFRLKAIPDALMAIVAALSLDSGKRAKAALERT